MNYINKDVKDVLKVEIYYREEERKKGTARVYGIIDENGRATIDSTSLESKSNTKKRHRTRKIY